MNDPCYARLLPTHPAYRWHRAWRTVHHAATHHAPVVEIVCPKAPGALPPSPLPGGASGYAAPSVATGVALPGPVARHYGAGSSYLVPLGAGALGTGTALHAIGWPAGVWPSWTGGGWLHTIWRAMGGPSASPFLPHQMVNVPEPSSVVILGAAVLVLMLLRWRRL